MAATPEKRLSATPVSDVVDSQTRALSLLSAAAFELDTSKPNTGFKWLSLSDISGILRCPESRIPGSQSAFHHLLREDAVSTRSSAINTLTYDGAQYCETYKITAFDGSSLWIEERGERLSGRGKTPKNIIGVIRDVTADRRTEMDAAFSGNIDPLTGLWTAVRFAQAVEQERNFDAPRVIPPLLGCLTLSELESIRREHGPEIADLLTVKIASHLKDTLAPHGMIARIDADSFGCLLGNSSQEEALTEITNVLKWIGETSFSTASGPLQVGASAALSPLKTSEHSSKHSISLLAGQAREAEIGSCQIINAPNDAPDHTLRTQKYSADDILSALTDKRLSLAYQPIIDARSRKIDHYECLLRLNTGGKITSAWQMILAAEDLALIHLLDRRSLEIGSELLVQNPDLHLAFNVSAGTIKNQFAAENYLQCLRAMGPAANRVTLELTETCALSTPSVASKFASRARGLGCRFAIDDFGSGHTSFHNILAIEADIIKLDGSMITDIAATPHKQTFVRMLVDLSQTLGLKTVAEMVDSEADAKALSRLGVDYFQGFMFGKPGPAPVEMPPLKTGLSQP